MRHFKISDPAGLETPVEGISRMGITFNTTLPILARYLLLAGLLFQSAFGQMSNSGNTAQRAISKSKSSTTARRREAKHSARQKNNENELAVGSWGGEHIRMVNTGEGATLELDCAHATIEQKIRLNQENCFDVRGTYFREHAGPDRPGEQAQSRPARFKGCLRQSTMDLTVTSGGTSESSNFTLVYGRAARITKCL